MSIGKKLSPILLGLELTILEFNAFVGEKPNYSKNDFKSATTIFMSCLLDKMYELQDEEKMEKIDRENMATKAGEELRKFIKTFTGLDTYNFYK